MVVRIDTMFLLFRSGSPTLAIVRAELARGQVLFLVPNLQYQSTEGTADQIDYYI